MANIRLLPSPNVAYQHTVANGRSYAATPGATLDAPDFDAGVLTANGWIKVAEVGATAARPSTPASGRQYFDSTLGVTVTFDGSKWRDPATGNAV